LAEHPYGSIDRNHLLWATTDQDALITCYQTTPGGGWSGWSSFLNAPPVLDIAACQQNDGTVASWILDQKQQLWCAWQTSPGGDWSGWSGPNWNGAKQPFQTLAASQQGGSRGAQLWATDQSNAVWSTFQESPGGGWSGWSGPNWNDAPQLEQMAGCQQNNGCVVMFGIDMNLMTKATFQSSPGGDWGPWGP